MEGKTKECQIKFRLTAEMKEKIEQTAARKDVSASWVIREALKKYFQEDKKYDGIEIINAINEATRNIQKEER